MVINMPIKILLDRFSKIWFIIILMDNRVERVIVRVIFLDTSIMIINGIRSLGVILGVIFINIVFNFFIFIKFMVIHIVVEFIRLKMKLLVGLMVKGFRLIRLFIIIMNNIELNIVL
jgi:hypothetical protein